MAAVKKTETPKISITTSRPAIEGDKSHDKKKVIIVGAVVILLVALIIWKRK